MRKFLILLILLVVFTSKGFALNVQSVELKLKEVSYTAHDSILDIPPERRKMFGFELSASSNLTEPNIEISNTGLENARLFSSGRFHIELLPSNVAKVFPLLEWLDIKRATLKEIHKEDIFDLKNLIILDLESNFIEYVEFELFIGNKHLQFIDLRNNRISFVDPTAFEGLLYLKVLRLYENKCSNINEQTIILYLNATSNRYNGKCWTTFGEIDRNFKSLRKNQNLLKAKIDDLISNPPEREVNTDTSNNNTNSSESSINIILILFGTVQVITIIVLIFMFRKLKKKNSSSLKTNIAFENQSNIELEERYQDIGTFNQDVEYEDPQTLMTNRQEPKNSLTFDGDYAEVNGLKVSCEEYAEVGDKNVKLNKNFAENPEYGVVQDKADLPEYAEVNMDAKKAYHKK